MHYINTIILAQSGVAASSAASRTGTREIAMPRSHTRTCALPQTNSALPQGNLFQNIDTKGPSHRPPTTDAGADATTQTTTPSPNLPIPPQSFNHKIKGDDHNHDEGNIDPEHARDGTGASPPTFDTVPSCTVLSRRLQPYQSLSRSLTTMSRQRQQARRGIYRFKACCDGTEPLLLLPTLFQAARPLSRRLRPSSTQLKVQTRPTL